MNWEQIFRVWSEPLGKTESARAENAERMIKSAIQNSQVLATKDISVFVQGSYKNNTNIREDSDVDICVRLNTLVSTDYSLVSGMNDELAGLVTATYSYQQFKNDIEQALIHKFGSSGVSRGDKAFDVHANSYRVDADVVPAIQGRLYYDYGKNDFATGTCIKPDSGGVVYNWPEQNYKNGIEKNNETNYRFKYIVRCIKRLKNLLAEKGDYSATLIPSYLIECLIYIVPDDYFKINSFKTNVEECIKYLNNHIDLENWMEINKFKPLFGSGQKWRKERVKEFLSIAFGYIQNN